MWLTGASQAGLIKLGVCEGWSSSIKIVSMFHQLLHHEARTKKQHCIKPVMGSVLQEFIGLTNIMKIYIYKCGKMSLWKALHTHIRLNINKLNFFSVFIKGTQVHFKVLHQGSVTLFSASHKMRNQ